MSNELWLCVCGFNDKSWQTNHSQSEIRSLPIWARRIHPGQLVFPIPTLDNDHDDAQYRWNHFCSCIQLVAMLSVTISQQMITPPRRAHFLRQQPIRSGSGKENSILAIAVSSILLHECASLPFSIQLLLLPSFLAVRDASVRGVGVTGVDVFNLGRREGMIVGCLPCVRFGGSPGWCFISSLGCPQFGCVLFPWMYHDAG
jgi:hypothetical protein